MATKAKPAVVESLSQPCTVCGGVLSPEGDCTVCGTKHEVAANGSVAVAPTGRARNGDNGLSQWLSGEGGDSTLQAWLGVAPPQPAAPDTSVEALKKWLTGEEGAFDEWLGGVAVASAEVPGDVGRKIKDLQGRLDERERELRARELELGGLRAEVEAFRKTVTSELANFKSDRFDPVRYIEDTAMLNKELQTEIAKRKELEEEIEHIKKGSIAVIKYVKAQQLKSGSSPEMKKRLAEEAKARHQLEVQNQENQDLIAALRAQIDKNLLSQPAEFRELKQKEIALAEKEAALKSKEAEVANLEEAAKTGGGAPNGAGAASEELRERFEEELREKEQEYRAREDELKKANIALEEQVSKYKIEDKVRAEAEQLKGKSKGEIDSILAKKQNEILAKEKSVLIREAEIQRLKEELDGKEDELKKLKEPLGY